MLREPYCPRAKLTANALRDCHSGDSGTSYIEPGSPWQNLFVESFGSCVRDELLALEGFDSLLGASNANDARGRLVSSSLVND